jgi:hypothetical protein
VSLIVGSPPASPAIDRTHHLCSPFVILTANLPLPISSHLGLDCICCVLTLWRPTDNERGEVMELITLIFLPRRHDHPRTEDAEKVLSNREREREKRETQGQEGDIRQRHGVQDMPKHAIVRTPPHACRTRLSALLPHHGKEGNGEDGEQAASCSKNNGC